MTLSTLTIFAVTGGMLALKLAVMIVAVVLLAKAMSPGRSGSAPFPRARLDMKLSSRTGSLKN